MLELKNYSVSVETKKIINNLDFTFEKGKVYAIMGPNGSGKSTLALSLAGSPMLSCDPSSRADMNGVDIIGKKVEERVKMGIFTTLQSPPQLSGITLFQMMRIALKEKIKPIDLRHEIKKFADRLSIPAELLNRSHNDGFSGGERKKMEVLQFALLNPQLTFFDEIDTGVDVDAIKTIGSFLAEVRTPEKTYVIITHSNALLKLIRPDVVVIMKEGRITQTGNADLAQDIEGSGYASFDLK